MTTPPRKPRRWILSVIVGLMASMLFGATQLAPGPEAAELATGLIMGQTVRMLAWWGRVEREALQAEARQRRRTAEERPRTAVQEHYRQVMMGDRDRK
jgi:hypothetical protein